MLSGALHDAASIAHLAPVGMIFVPSVGGISHSEKGTLVQKTSRMGLKSCWMLWSIYSPWRIELTNHMASSLSISGTALLSIDLQELDLNPNIGLLAQQDEQVTQRYLHHMNTVVIPQVATLQSACRARQIEVVHARIQSLTRDGRDRSKQHKVMGIHVSPDDPSAQFIREVGPVGDEMVFNKTASGVFASTNSITYLRISTSRPSSCAASSPMSVLRVPYDRGVT